MRVAFLLPWVQPSRESHCQVRLHPEASTHPGPAVVWKVVASQGPQAIPLAGPMHWKATQVKNAVKVKGECVCGNYSSGQTVKIKQHLPSQWASPPWDHEPRSRTPHSREVISSDHTPSKKKGRIHTGGVTVKSLTGNSLFYILAQRRIDIFANSSDLLFYIAPVDGAKVHLFE